MLTRHDLRSLDGDYAAALPRPMDDADAPLDIVRDIIADVRHRGDDAINELGARFDGAAAKPLKLGPEDLAAAVERVDPAIIESLREAAASIKAFHVSQIEPAHSYQHKGMTITQNRQPVDRAGCYVPGGRAWYPSTVLMTAVIARAAGVREVVVCVPPKGDGKVIDVTLAAASIAEVDTVYACGGAQAIAAMAYGTETIDPVDVIVGPGNVFVALAKREVSGIVGVPSAFAGPSEICVVTDGNADPRYVAIDLMVQAEHGPDGLSWLIAYDEAAVDAVEAAMRDLLAVAPRREDIEATLAVGGHVALVRDGSQAIDVANVIAPEHLQLMTSDAASIVTGVRHAGAVFLGEMAPASLGDYIAGPSHVLPTNGTARFGGALGLEDFTKDVHIVSVTNEALQWAGPHVEVLAMAEGLDAHAESVRLRLADLDNEPTGRASA
ncbi:histidinol dehydrogenase [Acidimicrobiales bacterium]|nr:histidinol dehydrogenase [Acidimicrobiaceae bacterium]MDC3300251.1 histidinol dehydrogenase [Acidimicrobiales bacterium]